ncbi:MAG: MBL fold metallo-hydrolase [Pseudomonadota bacterium]
MGRTALLIVVVLLAGGVYLFRGDLAPHLLERALNSRMASDPVAALPDGLHLILCGAGAPLPDPERSGPCAAVIAGDTVVVVDAGSGGATNLQRLGIVPGRIEALFLTHFHSDHIDGLGQMALLRWTTGRHEAPLPVHGPTGVAEVVAGFNAAYRLDAGYRTAHHGTEVAPPAGAGSTAHPFTTPPQGKAATVWRDGGLTVTAFAVPHEPATPAVGYRFDYRGRSLVISGDTASSQNLTRFATDADLLVHEALAPHLVGIMSRAARRAGRGNVVRITDDILRYHTTPTEAAEVAAAAGVDHLLYYHVLPPLPVPGLGAAFLDGVDRVYDGGVTLGEDGTLVSLPEGSREIAISQRL